MTDPQLSDTARATLERFAAARDQLSSAAEGFQEAAIQLLMDYDIKADEYAQLAGFHLVGYIDEEIEILSQSIHAIERRLPIRPTKPSGTRWVPPLHASDLLFFVHGGSPEHDDYPTTAHENQLRHQKRIQQREADAAVTCGRGKNSNCRARQVYIGAGQYAGGCRIHLTLDETRNASKSYHRALWTIACPSCSASETEPCDPSTVIIQDGEYPKTRTHNGIGLHTTRLDSAALAQQG